MRPFKFGKHIIMLHEDYEAMRRERNEAVQMIEDMFNGKRCGMFRIKQAENDQLADAYKQLQRTMRERDMDNDRKLRELELANEQFQRTIRDLCAQLIMNGIEQHEE